MSGVRVSVEVDQQRVGGLALFGRVWDHRDSDRMRVSWGGRVLGVLGLQSKKNAT